MPVFARTVKHCWNQPEVGCFSEGGGTIITESAHRGSSGPRIQQQHQGQQQPHQSTGVVGSLETRPPRQGSLTQSPWGHLMAPFSKKPNHQHPRHQLEWGHSGRNSKHRLKGGKMSVSAMHCLCWRHWSLGLQKPSRVGA